MCPKGKWVHFLHQVTSPSTPLVGGKSRSLRETTVTPAPLLLPRDNPSPIHAVMSPEHNPPLKPDSEGFSHPVVMDAIPPQGFLLPGYIREVKAQLCWTPPKLGCMAFPADEKSWANMLWWIIYATNLDVYLLLIEYPWTIPIPSKLRIIWIYLVTFFKLFYRFYIAFGCFIALCAVDSLGLESKEGWVWKGTPMGSSAPNSMVKQMIWPC